MRANPEALRLLRERSGYSLRGLAAKAGVSPATLLRIENGTYAGRPATLKALADALDVPITAMTSQGGEAA